MRGVRCPHTILHDGLGGDNTFRFGGIDLSAFFLRKGVAAIQSHMMEFKLADCCID